MTPEEKEFHERTWNRVAQDYPQFTHEHDAFNDPWAVETLVLGNLIGFKPFENARVMDIGANAGIWTAYCALAGAKVDSYEADPVTFEVMNAMLSRTGLLNRVRPVNAAIWTYTGRCAFQGNGQDGTNARSAHRNGAIQIAGGGKWGDGDMTPGRFGGNVAAVTPEMQTIPCISFEDALGKETWDCVKVDIEGAEFELLSTVPEELLRKQVRYMHLEFHHGWADRQVYDRLIEKLQSIFTFQGVINQDPNALYQGYWEWIQLTNRLQ